MIRETAGLILMGNLGNKRVLRSSCQITSLMAIFNGGRERLRRIFATNWRKWRMSQHGRHQGWKFRFPAWNWENDAEFGIEISIVNKPLESLYVKFKSQESADFSNWFKNDSIPEVYPISTVLESLTQLVRRVEPECFSWQVDPAPSQNSLTHGAFRQGVSGENVETPAYSPDLAPRDFFRFFAMENNSKGQNFGATDGIQ